MATETLVKDALNKHYTFLERNTGDTDDAKLQHYVFNNDMVLANNRHFIAETRMEAQPNGDATTEGQSLQIIGAAIAYLATKDQKWLDMAIACYNAYLKYFYRIAENPMPSPAAPWYCNWIINGKEPVLSDWPIDWQTPTHSGFKSVELYYTSGLTVVPHGAPYYGEYLDLATFAFDGHLTWDAINARVQALKPNGDTDWDNPGEKYEVEWAILWTRRKIDYNGDPVDDVIYPESSIGTIQLKNHNINGSHKTNFACRVPVAQGGRFIGRNEPQHNRPCHVPINVANQSNASDAEEWFGEAAFLLWKITGNIEYYNAWQCVLETCKNYSDIDLYDRFFRRTKNATTPWTDGISYDWTYPNDREVNYGRDENGYITVNVPVSSDDEDTGVTVSMEQQSIWFRVNKDSILSMDLGGAETNGTPLTFTSSMHLSPEKNEDTTVEYYVPIGYSDNTDIHNVSVRLGDLTEVKDRITGKAYVIADARMLVSWNGATHNVISSNVDIGQGLKRVANVAHFTFPGNSYSCGGEIGFWMQDGKRLDVKSILIKTNHIMRINLDDPNTGVSYYGIIPSTNEKWHVVNITKDMLLSEAWVDEHGYTGVDTNPISSLNVDGIFIKPYDAEVESYFDLYCVNDIPPQFDSDSAYTIKFTLNIKGNSDYTALVGDCTIKNYRLDSLAYTPGTIPFSNNLLPDSDQFDAWRGLPYPGYQHPFIYTHERSPGEWDTRLNNMVNFLYDSQQWYKNKFNVLGPGASAYIWNRWDSLGYGPADTWTMYHWGNDTAWSGYQPRAFNSAARAWYELVLEGKEVPSKLIQYTENWIKFLVSFVPEHGGRTPTEFPMESPPIADPNDFTGHMAGLFLSGACFAKIAGSTVSGLDNLIEQIADEILRNQVLEGSFDSFIMNGGWSPAIRKSTGSGVENNGMFFGFWSGEILRGLGMYILSKNIGVGQSIYGDNDYDDDERPKDCNPDNLPNPSASQPEWNPPNGSVSHLEFTSGTTGSATLIDEELHEWRISKILGYKTSTGFCFRDMRYNIPNVKTFTYGSEFANAVNRWLYFTVLADDSKSLTYHKVNNFNKLPKPPKRYDNIYRSDLPDESMQVTFYLEGTQREGTEYSTGSEDSPATSIRWGSWQPWVGTYTINITSNLEKHCALLVEACRKQTFARKAKEFDPSLP